MAFTIEKQEPLQKSSQQYIISKISHELRNPLALMYSTFQLIEAQHPEAKEFKYWNELRSDMEFMIQLLQDLSLYNNGEYLHKTMFSSYEFLSNICLSFAASILEERILFSSKLSKSLPVICADKIKLKEVLLNLLKNAKESISSNGSIALHASVEYDQLLIQIIDDGCGIPAEWRDSIFDEFVTHKEGGTGLGLALTKRIVEAHEGTILIDSEVGKGSCFIIKIPLKI